MPKSKTIKQRFEELGFIRIGKATVSMKLVFKNHGETTGYIIQHLFIQQNLRYQPVADPGR